MKIVIDDSAIEKVEDLNKMYKKAWGKEVDYRIAPRGITQERLVKCLELMIEENLSLVVAYNELFK